MGVALRALAGPAIVALCGIYAFAVLRRYLARAKTIRENGCEPLPHFPHKNVLLAGLDMLGEHKKAIQEHRFMKRQQEEFDTYGPTWQWSCFGGEFIHTIDPLNIESVLSKEPHKWGVAPMRWPAARFLGDGVVTADGPYWKQARDLTKPALKRSEFIGFQLAEFHLQRFLSAIPKDGSTIDVYPLAKGLMVDYSSEYFWGESINCLTADSSKELLDALETCLSGVGDAVFLNIFFGKISALVPSSKAFKKGCRLVHGYANQRITWAYGRHGSSAEKPQQDKKIVLVEELVKETKDISLIRSSTVSFFSAGVDTMAITISHIMFFLSRHPEVVSKLRSEVTALGPGKPNIEALKSMTYLRAIINETLRLFPVGTTAQRVAMEDTILPRGGGSNGDSQVFVRKGTTFIVGYYALHRNEDIWGSDAAVFKPERWERNPAPWCYAPFGGGLRACPGQQLALANLSYIITRIFQEFKDVESRDSRPWKEHLSIVLSNENGAAVAFIPA